MILSISIHKHTFTNEDKKDIAHRRASELKHRIADYLAVKDTIKTGFDIQQKAAQNREKLLHHYNASMEQWQDWQWQMNHRINNVTTLAQILSLDIEGFSQIKQVGNRYRWSISPYYASLIVDQPVDPIYLQSVPSVEELDETGHADPMAEEFTSPAPCITRRYPDRLIINVTNMCAMYCRHCQRKRNIGEQDHHSKKSPLL